MMIDVDDVEYARPGSTGVGHDNFSSNRQPQVALGRVLATTQDVPLRTEHGGDPHSEPSIDVGHALGGDWTDSRTGGASRKGRRRLPRPPAIRQSKHQAIPIVEIDQTATGREEGPLGGTSDPRRKMTPMVPSQLSAGAGSNLRANLRTKLR